MNAPPHLGLGPQAVEPCSDCRCACGSLLARVVDAAVELKCRRCKRTHRIPLAPELRSGSVRAPEESD